VRSQQLELDVSEKRHWKEFGLTVVFLHMLTECNYHLLSSHLITRSMAYYAEHFVDDYAIPEMRRECRQLSSESHRRFAKGARALIATYRRRWEIKLPTTVIRTSPIIFRGSDNQDDSA